MSAEKSGRTAPKKVGRPFEKGRSGNPGGRPKVIAEVRDLARAHTEAAIRALVDNLADESGMVRNVAAQALLDRGWGKAPATMAGEGGEGDAQLVVKVVRFSDA